MIMVKEILTVDDAIEALEEYNYSEEGLDVIDTLIWEFLYKQGNANLVEERVTGPAPYSIAIAEAIDYTMEEVKYSGRHEDVKLVCSRLSGDKDRAVCKVVSEKDPSIEYATVPVPAGIARLVILKALAKGTWVDKVELDL